MNESVIGESLGEFGADSGVLHYLDDDGPELLRYATLVAARHACHPALEVVEAVYEWQGAPLIYLVGADALRGRRHLRQVRRLLAMRGDAPYVGVVAPGSLEVYRLALDRKSLRQARVAWEDDRDVPKSAVLARLGNLRPDATITRKNWISNVILTLLSSSTTRLIDDFGLSHEDAISLVGRVLFTRFLADRSLLPRRMSDSATVGSLFDSREVAQETSRWLDRRFNGDLLPLSPDVFVALPQPAYGVLGDILRRAPDGQLSLVWEEKWANLDFAHIPVGVLSQAYELYLRDHEPDRQRREGGYFTPMPIVELMVKASFRALERSDSSRSAKVLDPSVGGGVFLLTAFRELVAAHWRAEGRRPDTDVLRRILYNQLVGFDINEAAIRFAALGLYLLFIELDPDTTRNANFRFEDLRGRVLHRVQAEDEQKGAALGSLGPLVDDGHRGQYDLVVGNPPWTSSSGLPEWSLVRETVARIARSRGIATTTPPLPKKGLDLPFLWRAMEWAKPDGQIAFALHARLLFQQGAGMPQARRAVFEALNVTSVINGVELRQTGIWPGVSAPFCLLFGTNKKPGPDAGFRFISPRLEASLNRAGVMRVDAINAELVTQQQLAETPDLLKVIFRGSNADLNILRRIRAQEHPTLKAFWRERIGEDRGRMRGSGNGYQKLKRSSEVRRGEVLRGFDASHLKGLPEFTTSFLESMFVERGLLPSFEHDRVHRVRSAELYVGPLLLVHKSPPVATGRIGVTISEGDVVFNETFYGYSTRLHSQPSLLARYLGLVLGSRFVVWLALVTSGEFGFEREVIEKATLDRMPVPDFDLLSRARHREIASLSDGLQSGGASWREVDEWVASLYGLGQRDLEVIGDTLRFNLPFAENRRRSQTPPTSAERRRFCHVLQEELKPWCERLGSELSVDDVPQMEMSPWYAVRLRPQRGRRRPLVVPSDWTGLLGAADDAAASEVLYPEESGGLLVGRLAQGRYWSVTQARELAQRIVWSHVDLLKGHA